MLFIKIKWVKLCGAMTAAGSQSVSVWDAQSAYVAAMFGFVVPMTSGCSEGIIASSLAVPQATDGPSVAADRTSVFLSG